MALAFCGLAAAEPTPAPVRAEIDALLHRLQASGCQFERNGTWYGSADAKAHLLDKLAYVERRRTLQSTEQFIELIGSSSSVSGKPYRVKCGNAAPVESRQWLTRELSAVRRQ
ncbi:MAG TPA: DUF5329 domain-containing protein [Burkholderiales bacterium]|nr:DUF5329 domain-containing protein [Burkholderiales bacterium]